jgi:hypothetical protein
VARRGRGAARRRRPTAPAELDAAWACAASFPAEPPRGPRRRHASPSVDGRCPRARTPERVAAARRRTVGARTPVAARPQRQGGPASPGPNPLRDRPADDRRARGPLAPARRRRDRARGAPAARARHRTPPARDARARRPRRAVGARRSGGAPRAVPHRRTFCARRPRAAPRDAARCARRLAALPGRRDGRRHCDRAACRHPANAARCRGAAACRARPRPGDRPVGPRHAAPDGRPYVRVAPRRSRARVMPRGRSPAPWSAARRCGRAGDARRRGAVPTGVAYRSRVAGRARVVAPRRGRTASSRPAGWGRPALGRRGESSRPRRG